MNELDNGSLEDTDLDNKESDNNNLKNSDLDKNTPNVKEKSSDNVYRKTNKTSDIYERFINRMQGIGESNVDKNSSNTNFKEKLSHTKTVSEPLDNIEGQLFLETEQIPHHDQKIDTQQLETSKANTDNGLELSLLSLHEDPTPDNENDNAPAPVTTPATPTDLEADSDIKQTSVTEDKQIGSLKIKLLIIGIVCGLLLSGLVVAILTMTGIFANSESATKSSNTTVMSVDEAEAASIKPLSNEEMVAKSDDISEANLLDNTVTTDELPVDDPIDESKLSDEQIKDTLSKPSTTQLVTEVAPTTDTEADLIKNSDSEAIISYEDFAEEAQSTLYRETNN
ncbi:MULTISPECIES: hypothetical protein [unclassified Psychrobacter]|uniref:hypothetical protein n=1 Tax=unclassified Psychrobacter TaxID=196806 RepID=UPI00071E8313|nr:MULTISPECIES: hypothetical protein [unclassified Psychrobacter]OLF38480.1 hypothetical protein BTV98_06545 [Psychrobacter sp. Cmf 22.2]